MYVKRIPKTIQEKLKARERALSFSSQSTFGQEKDDGSLSWEALRRNVRYLNIETRLGYLSKQKAMLKYIEENLN